jgi:hypothetical protein
MKEHLYLPVVASLDDTSYLFERNHSLPLLAIAERRWFKGGMSSTDDRGDFHMAWGARC